MDEAKTPDVNLTTNGEGSVMADLITESESQVTEMDTDNTPNDGATSRGIIPEENTSEPPGNEQEVSTDPKPLDSPTDDRLSPPPEPEEPDIQHMETKPDNMLSQTRCDSPSMHSNNTPVTPDSPFGLANGELHNHKDAYSTDVSPRLDKVSSDKQLEKPDWRRYYIDTTAPFESVKAAVSKFGGIVDWKAHKIQTVERRKYIEQELGKANEEIPLFKKKSEAAEESKQQVLKELDNTKRLIEELKLNLERAQTEERQAKQDAELAELRVEEIEQGIADESSVATRVQLEVAHARHEAAVSELGNVKNELTNLQKDYDLLTFDRDLAIRKAKDAMSSSKEIEKAVEQLTIELITTKEMLESTHAAHLEAEEHRIGVAMAREQDALNWEKELSLAEEELEKLNQEIVSTEDLKSRLDTASVLLQDLKVELAAYMGENGAHNSKTNNTHKDMQAAIAMAKMNLEEVKKNIEKATDEVNSLKLAANSLNSELEQEKMTLSTIRQREGMASVAAASLEAELNKTISEIGIIQAKEKEAREKMAELPKQLQKAADEAKHAKSLAEEAREEVNKAREVADLAKAGANKMESKLVVAQKEIEVAKASEKLALTAISALHQSESARSNNSEPEKGVTLSLEEYYELNKKAHDAENDAKMRVSEAMSHINIAKESESKTLTELDQVDLNLAAKREELAMALQKAEKAKEGKLEVEQELRTWRAEHEQRRKARDESGHKMISRSSNSRGSFEESKSARSSSHSSSLNHKSESNIIATESSPDVKPRKKKKRSFFPKLFMFFGRKKGHSNKN